MSDTKKMATVPVLPTGPLTPELLEECRRKCEEAGLVLAEPKPLYETDVDPEFGQFTREQP